MAVSMDDLISKLPQLPTTSRDAVTTSERSGVSTVWKDGDFIKWIDEAKKIQFSKVQSDIQPWFVYWFYTGQLPPATSAGDLYLAMASTLIDPNQPSERLFPHMVDDKGTNNKVLSYENLSHQTMLQNLQTAFDGMCPEKITSTVTVRGATGAVSGFVTSSGVQTVIQPAAKKPEVLVEPGSGPSTVSNDALRALIGFDTPEEQPTPVSQPVEHLMEDPALLKTTVWGMTGAPSILTKQAAILEVKKAFALLALAKEGKLESSDEEKKTLLAGLGLEETLSDDLNEKASVKLQISLTYLWLFLLRGLVKFDATMWTYLRVLYYPRCITIGRSGAGYLTVMPPEVSFRAVYAALRSGEWGFKQCFILVVDKYVNTPTQASTVAMPTKQILWAAVLLSTRWTGFQVIALALKLVLFMNATKVTNVLFAFGDSTTMGSTFEFIRFACRYLTYSEGHVYKAPTPNVLTGLDEGYDPYIAWSKVIVNSLFPSHGGAQNRPYLYRMAKVCSEYGASSLGMVALTGYTVTAADNRVVEKIIERYVNPTTSAAPNVEYLSASTAL
nr:MAG: hypothetical protein [Rhabdoviridae sp.]